MELWGSCRQAFVLGAAPAPRVGLRAPLARSAARNPRVSQRSSARGSVRPTLPFPVRKNCTGAPGSPGGRLTCADPPTPPSMKPSPPCGPHCRGSSVSPSSPAGRQGRRIRAAQRSSELPPSGSLGQRTWGRVLPLPYPRFSLRTVISVPWGKPLWGSRCFSEPGITP